MHNKTFLERRQNTIDMGRLQTLRAEHEAMDCHLSDGDMRIFHDRMPGALTRQATQEVFMNSSRPLFINAVDLLVAAHTGL